MLGASLEELFLHVETNTDYIHGGQFLSHKLMQEPLSQLAPTPDLGPRSLLYSLCSILPLLLSILLLR